MLLMGTDHFFLRPLDSMVDLRHPFAVLATRTSSTYIDVALSPTPAHRDRRTVSLKAQTRSARHWQLPMLASAARLALPTY